MRAHYIINFSQKDVFDLLILTAVSGVACESEGGGEEGSNSTVGKTQS